MSNPGKSEMFHRLIKVKMELDMVEIFGPATVSTEINPPTSTLKFQLSPPLDYALLCGMLSDRRCKRALRSS